MYNYEKYSTGGASKDKHNTDEAECYIYLETPPSVVQSFI